MSYADIPEELATRTQWVCAWANSKTPMQISERKGASSTRPDTWGEMAAALLAVQNGVYDNIGFVFTPDDPYVGIDIDAGFDDDGVLTDLAADIISKCESYTEVSRSGRGVHIILRGSLPFKGKNNRQGVEIYSEARYFLMTGKQLVYKNIIDNQPAIDYVLQRYFPEDQPRESGTTERRPRIYSRTYTAPQPGKVSLTPQYPPIPAGCRNLSLTSLAGQLHTQGYTKGQIYKELLRCNSAACRPPLSQGEVERIVESVTKYRRDR